MIGANIRRIRTAQKMTQSALAEKSGVSVQMINQIEWGTKVPSVPTLVRIAQALQCSTDEILSEEEHDGAIYKSAGG